MSAPVVMYQSTVVIYQKEIVSMLLATITNIQNSDSTESNVLCPMLLPKV